MTHAAPAEAIAREIEQAARDVERIRALSRTEPHVFVEEKDEAARRLVGLAAKVRNTFGGTPARMQAGTIEISTSVFAPSRRVRVEVRRARVPA